MSREVTRGDGWCLFFFFKQKTAYEMRISEWSSDVCSSDLSGQGAGNADRKRAADLRRDRVADRILPGEARLLQSLQVACDLGAEHVQLARDDAVALGDDLDDLGEGRLVFGSQNAQVRSEERRAGQECSSTCRSRW